MLLIPNQPIKNWVPKKPADLQKEHFTEFLNKPAKIVIIGLGNHFSLPSYYLYQCLIEAQMGIEFMSTAAACRTYAILSGENRACILGLMCDEY